MKMIIKKEAYIKLRYFVNLVNSEISGMAKSFQDEDNNIIVEDFIIFQQKCTAGSTDIDNRSIAKFLYELQKNNEKTEDWNIWWHSHDTMGVFWSGTDDKTIEDHTGGGPYLLSLVTNKADDYKARLDVFPRDTSPFKKEVFCTYDIDVEIEDNEELDEKMEEIEKNIEEIEEQKEEAEKSFDKLLEEAQDAKLVIKTTSSTDVAIEKHCQEEIDAKVEKRIYFIDTRRRKNIYQKDKKTPKWNWWDEDQYEKEEWEKELEEVKEDIIIEGFQEDEDISIDDVQGKYSAK